MGVLRWRLGGAAGRAAGRAALYALCSTARGVLLAAVNSQLYFAEVVVAPTLNWVAPGDVSEGVDHLQMQRARIDGKVHSSKWLNERYGT